MAIKNEFEGEIVKFETFKISLERELRAYQLTIGDVLFIKPNHIKQWKLGEEITNPTFLEDMWWDGSSIKFEVPVGMKLRVIGIEWSKWRWWCFWKRRKQLSYTCEIVALS